MLGSLIAGVTDSRRRLWEQELMTSFSRRGQRAFRCSGGTATPCRRFRRFWNHRHRDTQTPVVGQSSGRRKVYPYVDYQCDHSPPFCCSKMTECAVKCGKELVESGSMPVDGPSAAQIISYLGRLHAREKGLDCAGGVPQRTVHNKASILEWAKRWVEIRQLRWPVACAHPGCPTETDISNRR